jgi:hypothetical protein
VFILADVETGEEVFCMQSFAIKKTIEAAKKEFGDDISEVVFRFEFLGKTEVHGKPFNKFNGSYCTMSDYSAFKLGTEEPANKKGKK